jgi:hypothetical protein
MRDLHLTKREPPLGPRDAALAGRARQPGPASNTTLQFMPWQTHEPILHIALPPLHATHAVPPVPHCEVV